MKKLIQIIYSYLTLPILFLMTFFIALLNRKVRNAVVERFKINNKINDYLQKSTGEEKRIIIHCASMGEFEHIKPLIQKLSNIEKISIIVTFFSPSGYDNVKQFDGVSLIIYIPFDFVHSWKKLLNSIKPAMMIISKHDAWPNQVWVTKNQNIPIFLVNASLNENSSRIQGLAGFIYRYIYPEFDAIYCVSNGDKRRFEENFPGTNAVKTGDTKFDQVYLRKEMSKERKLIPNEWFEDHLVFLLGSIWPEDFGIFKNTLPVILNEYDHLKYIIVPHQLNSEFIENILTAFNNIQDINFFSDDFKNSSRILIIDRIGILADLYKYADFAYVGGSFKQGIHNVMEPAIYGLPVLYGPNHKNSYDAVKLLENNGSKIIVNENDVVVELKHLIENLDYRDSLGQKALKFAQQNTGTTERLIEMWKSILS
jgi:3-deoxy-D-manno-octulosonic-acid transferase